MFNQQKMENLMIIILITNLVMLKKIKMKFKLLTNMLESIMFLKI